MLFLCILYTTFTQTLKGGISMGYILNLLLFKNVDEAIKAKKEKLDEIRVIKASLVKAEYELGQIDEAIKELEKKDKENF